MQLVAIAVMHKAGNKLWRKKQACARINGLNRAGAHHWRFPHVQHLYAHPGAGRSPMRRARRIAEARLLAAVVRSRRKYNAAVRLQAHLPMFGPLNRYNLQAGAVCVVSQQALRRQGKRALLQYQKTVCRKIGQTLAVHIGELRQGHARIRARPVGYPVAEGNIAGKACLGREDQLAICVSNAAVLNAPEMIQLQAVAFRVCVVLQQPAERKGAVHLQGEAIILQIGRVIDIAHRNQGPSGDDFSLGIAELVQKRGSAHKTRLCLKADIAVCILPHPAMRSPAKTGKAKGRGAVAVHCPRLLQQGRIKKAQGGILRGDEVCALLNCRRQGRYCRGRLGSGRGLQGLPLALAQRSAAKGRTVQHISPHTGKALVACPARRAGQGIEAMPVIPPALCIRRYLGLAAVSQKIAIADQSTVVIGR